MTKIAPSFNSAKLMFIVTGRMRSVRPHHPGVSLGKDSSAPSLAHVIASHRRALLSPCMLSRGVWGSPGGQTDMQTWPSHWRNKAGPGVTALLLVSEGYWSSARMSASLVWEQRGTNAGQASVSVSSDNTGKRLLVRHIPHEQMPCEMMWKQCVPVSLLRASYFTFVELCTFTQRWREPGVLWWAKLLLLTHLTLRLGF